MSRTFAPRAVLGAALLALVAACSDDPGARVTAPEAVSANNILSTVNFRRTVDSIASALVPANSGDYDIPTAGALDTFEIAVERVMAGRVAGADSILDRYGYDAYRMVESSSGDTFSILRERTDATTRKFTRGWGMYAFNPRAQNAADVHVNHPIDDLNSEDIAAELYRDCHCRWFLMAGARRAANVAGDTASDMARHTNTVFHTVHAEVAAAGTRAVSIHGFRRSKHPNLPAGVDQVLSNGRNDATTTPTYLPADTVLRRRLVNGGFVAGLFRFDSGYNELGATVNPQGRHSNNVLGWGHWIHVENDSTVRADSTQWLSVAETLRQWIVDHPAL